jgi:hypothetical protein
MPLSSCDHATMRRAPSAAPTAPSSPSTPAENPRDEPFLSLYAVLLGMSVPSAADYPPPNQTACAVNHSYLPRIHLPRRIVFKTRPSPCSLRRAGDENLFISYYMPLPKVSSPQALSAARAKKHATPLLMLLVIRGQGRDHYLDEGSTCLPRTAKAREPASFQVILPLAPTRR